MFLQPKQNFLNHLITIVWATISSLFAQQMFLVAPEVLWPSSHSQSVNPRIRLLFILIGSAIKSLMGWSNAQRVTAPATTILYVLQTITYQNIAKKLWLTQLEIWIKVTCWFLRNSNRLIFALFLNVKEFSIFLKYVFQFIKRTREPNFHGNFYVWNVLVWFPYFNMSTFVGYLMPKTSL